MTNRVLLNNVDHHDLRVVLGHGAAFGDAVNQSLIFPTEFEAAQRDYPILFRKDAEGRFQAVVLLGLDRDENLFLDGQGWPDRYVPAVQQRGPFMIGFREWEDAGERHREPMIHVDVDHPRIGRDEGEPVFLPQGGHSPYLDHIVRVLRMIHDGLEMIEPMFAAFAEEGLIEPLLLQISLDETTRYDLPDFYSIDTGRLAQLDGAALERLHRVGYLRMAFMVVASLANVSQLIERKNRKRAAGASPAPQPAWEPA